MMLQLSIYDRIKFIYKSFFLLTKTKVYLLRKDNIVNFWIERFLKDFTYFRSNFELS